MTDLLTTETTSVIRAQTMPTFYPSTRQRTLAAKHLTGQDDEADSIYKDAFIIQVFQHWRIKTLEHQQMERNHATNNQFSQAMSHSATPVPAVDLTATKTDQSIVVKEEALIAPPKPIFTLEKRVTSPPASYTRRKQNLTRQTSATSEPVNPNLLAPHAKAKSTTGSISSNKKSTKPIQVFIEPKKTHPAPIPRPIALPSFEESLINKATINAIQPGHSDDDEISDHESRQESLYIRQRNLRKPISKRPESVPYVFPEHVHVPTAVFVIDPQGHCRNFDLQSESLQESSVIPHAVTAPSILDQCALHSIGEEEEDNDRAHDSDDETPIPLGRRWSDGAMSEDEGQARTTDQPGPLQKMASAASVMKSETPSKTHVKLSRTKYLLMKLHLTPSVNKTEETTNNTRRRTVRRSSDKKRYQTR